MPPEPVLAAAQLDGAWLSAVEFRDNPAFDPERDRVTYLLEQTTEVDLFPDDEEKGAVVRLRLEVNWAHEEGESREVPFELSLEVAGLLTWLRPDATDDFMRAWLEYNGTYLLWPYARSYISMITGASSNAPLTIYTMRVPNPPSIEEGNPSAPQAAGHEG